MTKDEVLKEINSYIEMTKVPFLDHEALDILINDIYTLLGDSAYEWLSTYNDFLNKSPLIELKSNPGLGIQSLRNAITNLNTINRNIG